jgi:hypothetical protein
MIHLVMAKRADKKEHKDPKEFGAALLVPAGLFIGMGLGFLYGRLLEGIFIGLGVGFAVFGILNLFRKRK